MTLTPQDIERPRAEENPRPEPRDETVRLRARDRRAPVQAEAGFPPGSIAWSEHLLVWQAYAAKYGRDQSAERIAERGGFGHLEAEVLLRRPLETWRPLAATIR